MSPLSIVLILVPLSFVVTFAWAPYLINFLYQRGLTRQDEKHRPTFRYLQQSKTNLISMGGVLVLVTVSVLAPLLLGFTAEVKLLLLTFFLFGVLGAVDDLKKLLFVGGRYWGLKRWSILAVQSAFALVVSMFFYLWIGEAVVQIPHLGGSPWLFELGSWSILYGALLIVATSNAFNITDGIDGLSPGLLIIALTAFLVLSMAFHHFVVGGFIALWIGSLLVYLYFNIHPARFMMGDVGAQAFGAALAVIALLLHQTFVLPVIGALFFVEAASSAAQLTYRRITGKKLFPVAPLHYMCQIRRWSEGKICMRFWLFGAVAAYVGLMIALL